MELEKMVRKLICQVNLLKEKLELCCPSVIPVTCKQKTVVSEYNFTHSTINNTFDKDLVIVPNTLVGSTDFGLYMDSLIAEIGGTYEINLIPLTGNYEIILTNAEIPLNYTGIFVEPGVNQELLWSVVEGCDGYSGGSGSGSGAGELEI